MIKLYEFPKAVHYSDLIELVEERNCIRVNDFAGMFSKQATEYENNLKREYLKQNHPELEQYLYTLNSPSRQEDWPTDSIEMQMRIKINKILNQSNIEKETEAKFPYQNYWHYLINENDVQQGINWISIPTEGSSPEWVLEINKMILDIVEESEAYDKDEQLLCVYIEW